MDPARREITVDDTLLSEGDYVITWGWNSDKDCIAECIGIIKQIIRDPRSNVDCDYHVILDNFRPNNFYVIREPCDVTKISAQDRILWYLSQ